MPTRTVPLLAAFAFTLVMPVAASAQDSSPGVMDWNASCQVPASPSPQATPGCGPGAQVPTAVIDVSGEVYRIELSSSEALAGARALLAGTSAATIPSGAVVVDDPGPNAPWSWHIDPATLEWAEMTAEVCDGRPTQLQDGVFTFERYCPWTARLLGIEGDPTAGPVQPGDPVTLPVRAAGGSSADDRSFALRMPLAAGTYTLAVDAGDNLDPTVSGCPAEVRLLASDGRPALGSGDPYPTIPDAGDVVLTWPDLPAGAYDLFLSFDCAWTASFGPGVTSAS
jgi:hypothetical protein